MLLMNVFLAAAWVAITGQTELANVFTGFVVGYLVLWAVSQTTGSTDYFLKVGRVVRFALYFLWELVVAAVRVAIDVLTPRHLVKPAILAVPIDTESDAETTTLANAITLTPGTLSLDVSPDGKTLYVHAMYAPDLEAARRAIQDGLGRRVREMYQ